MDAEPTPDGGGAGRTPRPPRTGLSTGPSTGPWAGPDLAPAALAACPVGLFGGSFDPVHQGHLTVVRAALGAAGVAHLVVVPARISPHKLDRAPAPGAARTELLRTALGTLPEALDGRLSIWTTELEREGPSFTVDTLRELARRRGPRSDRPRLVLGQDSLAGLPRWHERDELLERVELVVVERGGAESRDVALARLAGLLPEAVLARIEAGWVALERPSGASSTALRADLASGAGTGAELPPAVADGIRRAGLYRGGEPGAEGEP